MSELPRDSQERRITAVVDDSRNKGVWAFLKRKDPIPVHWMNAAPSQVDDPYYKLGTHPDLVEYLWDQLTRRLPENCRWVVAATPALVHPNTGVVFAFAAGMHVVAIRLPQDIRETALNAGAKVKHDYSDGSRLDVAEIGPEWVLIGWIKGAEDLCLSAYGYAARRN